MDDVARGTLQAAAAVAAASLVVAACWDPALLRFQAGPQLLEAACIPQQGLVDCARQPEAPQLP